jgi:hypothetical protein
MSSSDNVSVNISGGNVSGNLAIGPHSKAEQVNVVSSSLAQPLADLESAVDAYQGPPATRDALQHTHAEIVGELKAPSPDKGKILAKLASLSQLAGPAATIVQAAAVLAQAIPKIL